MRPFDPGSRGGARHGERGGCACHRIRELTGEPVSHVQIAPLRGTAREVMEMAAFTWWQLLEAMKWGMLTALLIGVIAAIGVYHLTKPLCPACRSTMPRRRQCPCLS